MKHFYLKTLKFNCNTFFNIIFRLFQNFNVDMRRLLKQHAHTHTCRAAHPHDAGYQEAWEVMLPTPLTHPPNVGARVTPTHCEADKNDQKNGQKNDQKNDRRNDQKNDQKND